MATPYKTSKAELVAIYRLEFYKKQKSWKYFSQERKKEEEKRRAARRAKLNQTYDIGPAPERDTDTGADVLDKEAEELKDLNLARIASIEEKQEVSKETDTEEGSPSMSSPDRVDDLNEAFVDTETEDTAILPTQLDSSVYPYSPKWSLQHWSTQRRKHLKKEDSSTPTQNTYPLQNAPIFPAQDDPNYPCQGTPVFPSQDIPNYPVQDTQAYPTLDINVYSPNFQGNPTQDSPNYFQNIQVFPNQDYQQNLQLCSPCETQGSKKLIQVFPSARSQAYPTDPNHPNPYDPGCLYSADVPTFSPALPQSGASADTGEPHQYGAYEVPEGWPRQSQVWTRHEWNEGLAEMAVPAGELAAGDAVDGPERVLGRAQRWLSGSHQSLPAHCDSVLSVSSESFSRGAALAPHSTEIDLRISDNSEEMAAGLSTAALSAAVARHADALNTLLGEAKKRDLSSPSLDKMYSFDEYPTLDVACPSSASDVIVAGSFRNTPDLVGQTELGASRGRGKRIHETPVIGIGCGRPYRI